MNKVQLNQLRDQIDQVDQQIISLLAKRMEVVDQVGKLKKQYQVKPLDASRWQQVVDARRQWAEDNQLNPDLIEKIWDLIHDQALEIEAAEEEQI
jgi:chorismate mutase